MDEACHGAGRGGFLGKRVHRFARGDIHGGGAHLKPGVAKDLGCGLGVLLAQISEQHVFACTDPPDDRQTDRSGTDEDGHIHAPKVRRGE